MSGTCSRNWRRSPAAAPASSRGRPERGHLDQAGMLGHGNSLPPAPEAATRTIQISRGAGSRARRPGQRRGCDSLIEFAQDGTRCLATKYASGPSTPAGRCPARAVHRCCRGPSAPGDGGACWKAARLKRPHAVMPGHHSDGDSVTERSCRCHSTRTRSCDQGRGPIRSEPQSPHAAASISAAMGGTGNLGVHPLRHAERGDL